MRESPQNLIISILFVTLVMVVAAVFLLVSDVPHPIPGVPVIQQGSPVELTPEEKDWIAAHPVIHVCPDPSLPPFEFRDRNGEYTGVAADYLAIISARTGLHFVADKRDNWSQCVSDIGQQKTDLLGGVYISDLRRDYLVYSNPYFKTPIVILTRSPGRTGLTLEDFTGKRLSAVEGFTTQKLLRERYPEILIDSVPDTKAGLREVSLGNAEAFFGDLPTATYIIAEEGIPNLQVSGEYTPQEPYSFNLAFGVRKDWPELAGILNKGLSSISPQERDASLKKYISLNLYPPVVSLQVFLAILIGAGCAILFILVILLWNRSLNSAVREKTHQLSEELEERKRAEAALLSSEEKYRTLVENLHVGVYQNLEEEKGQLIWANRAMVEIFGYESLEEFLRFPFIDHYVYPEQRKAFRDALKKEGFVQDYEIPMKRKDGTPIWVSVTSKIRYGPGGSIDWIDGILEDITERRTAKDELIRANNELQQAYAQLTQKEEELRHQYENLHKSQGALDLARKKLNILNAVTFQDIQNTVFSLSGYFELEKNITTDEKLRNYMEKQIRLVATIAESIRFANNYQNLGLHPPRWQNVQQSFLIGISHLSLEGISRHLEAEGLEIYADPLLENVFFTLAENVVLHAKGATTISLLCRKTAEGIVLVFEDNGTGIPYEKKEKIFERKLADKRGLGLFLAREILGITGISIRETGEPGKGARFEIHVPKGDYRLKEGR